MDVTASMTPRRSGVWPIQRDLEMMPRLLPTVRMAAVAAMAALSSCAGDPPTGTAPVTAPVAIAVSGNADAVAASLGRGVNLGNILEAPVEGQWGLRLSETLFDAARSAGVQTIRLPVRWSAHAGATAPYTIDPAFMARVDFAVDAALSRGMRIVIDMHHYRQLDGDALDPGETSVNAAILEERFVAMWSQIATHFRSRPETVLFELYNEPHGRQSASSWNLLFARGLAAVRAVDTTRYIVVGPVQWNSASQLAALTLPPVDQRLIVTIHNYEPFAFTHQGAEWAGMTNSPLTTCCTTTQLQDLSDPMRTAARWRDTWKRPVWVGEFGSYSKAPYASRVMYSRAVRDSMEAHGMTWAYWEFASGFGIYDAETNTMRAELRDALFR